MAKCEHCGYAGAVSKWCARCSSIDPLPSRRRLAYLFGALVIAAGGVAIVDLSPKVARIEVSKTIAQAQSFVPAPQDRSMARR
jgi:hypothetical protein